MLERLPEDMLFNFLIANFGSSKADSRPRIGAS